MNMRLRAGHMTIPKYVAPYSTLRTVLPHNALSYNDDPGVHQQVAITPKYGHYKGPGMYFCPNVVMMLSKRTTLD